MATRAGTLMSSHLTLGEIITRKWQMLASKGRRRRRSKGHFVVYAMEGRRFVVPLRFLQHPIFQVLLEMAEEEFGAARDGPLRVPCEEKLMEHVVSLLKTEGGRSNSFSSLAAAGVITSGGLI